MITPDLYVRIRGRVMGPYDHARLVTLRKQGQLSRIHEVSEDGVSWRKAGEYPALFSPTTSMSTAAASAIQTPPHQQAPSSSGATQVIPQPGPDSAPTAAAWYYSDGNNQIGPVNLLELKARVQSREIESTTLVWGPGLSTWSPAKDVAEVWSTAPTTAQPSRARSPVVAAIWMVVVLCILGGAGAGAYVLFNALGDSGNLLTHWGDWFDRYPRDAGKAQTVGGFGGLRLARDVDVRPAQRAHELAQRNRYPGRRRVRGSGLPLYLDRSGRT